MEEEKWTWHFIFHLSFLIWKYSFFVILILNVQRGLEKTGIWGYIVAWRCCKIWQYGTKDVWEYKQSVAQWLSSVSSSSPLLLPKPCLFHYPVDYSSRLQWLDRVSFHELFVTFTVGFPFHLKAWGKRFWSQQKSMPSVGPRRKLFPFFSAYSKVWFSDTAERASQGKVQVIKTFTILLAASWWFLS